MYPIKHSQKVKKAIYTVNLLKIYTCNTTIYGNKLIM